MLEVNNKLLFYRRYVLWTVSIILLIVPVFVLAQTNGGLGNLEGNLNLGTNLDLIQTIGKVINVFLSILGVIALLIVLYGGVTWLLSRGNAEQVAKAKKILSSGLIGLVIILASFVLASFIFSNLEDALHGDNGGSGGCTTPPCSGSLGGSDYLRATWISPTQSNVKLCMAVQAGFNYTVLWSSPVDKTSFRIEKDSDGSLFYNAATDKYGPGNDSEYLAFTHVNHEFEPNTKYHVILSNLTGVNPDTGARFSFRNPSMGKEWWFTTGTESDSTAPTVTTKQPGAGANLVCRRIAIGATFSEPMLSISFAGNVILEKLKADGTVAMPVSLSKPRFTNDFKTVSYNPVDAQGKIIALESNTKYRVTLKGDTAGAVNHGIQDACSIPMVADEVWQFETGVTENCEPVIDSITPAQGYYSDMVTLTGKNFFALPGEVYFNHFAAGNDSFDDSNNLVCWGEDACKAIDPTITEDTIKIKVPVSATTGPAYPQDDYDASDVRAGKVKISIASTFSNEKDPFTILSPYIDSLSPTSGGKGQWVSAIGWNFGSSPGQLLFDTTAGIPPGLCSDWWHETNVLVEIPDSLALANYPVELKTTSGRRSNQDWQFAVNDNPPGPGICSITPTSGRISGTPPPDLLPLSLTVVGTNFGNTKSANSKLNFNGNNISLEPKSADYTSWSNDKIVSQTPTTTSDINALGQGRWQVCAKVRISGKDLTSNCKPFQVKDIAGGSGATNIPPQVVSYAQCKTNTPSPSPAPGSKKVCPQAQIMARFTLPMDKDSFVGNVSIIPCNKGDTFTTDVAADCGSNETYTLSPQLNSKGQVQGFILNPSALTDDYWYRVVISDQVKSIYGIKMTAPYEWHWRVSSASENCQVNSLGISPSQTRVAIGDSRDLTGSAYTAQCVALDPADYSWTWNENDIHISMSATNPPVVNKIKVTGDSATETPAEVNVGITQAASLSAKSLITVGEGDGPGGLAGPPKITGMTPTSGRAEKDMKTVITLRGDDFGSSGSVWFTNTVTNKRIQAVRGDCGSWSNKEIIITSPNLLAEGAIGDTYKVEVITSRGTSAANPDSLKPVFTVTNEIKPGICSMVPNYGAAGTSITIKGYNFSDTKKAGTLYFPFGRFVSGPIDGDSRLVTKWTNKEIIYKVPTEPHSGEVWVEVDATNDGRYNPVASNKVQYYGTPFITDILPNTGPGGTWVTIKGGNFGWCDYLEAVGNPCSVVFTDSGGALVSADPLPDTCSDFNWWTNKQIVVKVPNLGSGEFISQVTVNSEDPPNLSSNSKEFNYNSNLPLGPGLCGIVPDTSTKPIVRTSLPYNNGKLVGENFGLTKAAGSKVKFSNSGDLSAAWSGTAINLSPIPNTTNSGDVTVEKEFTKVVGLECKFPKIQFGDTCIGGWDEAKQVLTLVSNPLAFIVEESSSGIGNLLLVSFQPANNDTNVCRNAEIVANFNRHLNSNSVSATNFKLTKGTVNVSGKVKLIKKDSFDAVAFIPDEPLEVNQLYKLTVENTVKGAVGESLNCALSPAGCVTIFTTGPDICKLSKITITPASYSFTKPSEQVNFSAQVYAADNQPLVATYNWSATPAGLVSIAPSAPDPTTLVVVGNKNGQNTLKVKAIGSAPGSGTLAAEAALDVFLCEVPWEFVDSNYNYRLRYCRAQTAATGDINFITNGSFTNDLTGWQNSGTDNTAWYSVVTPAAIPGLSQNNDNNVLQITKEYSGGSVRRMVKQQITGLKKNTTYYASVQFYNSLINSTNKAIPILFPTSNNDCASPWTHWTHLTNGAAGWQKAGVVFETKDNDKYTICLGVHPISPTDPVLFDNIEVRELSGALPALVKVIDKDNEKLFNLFDTKDVIGLKSFPNPDRLIPADWLKTIEEGRYVSVKPTTLDGYPAGVGGQTLYVSALNAKKFIANHIISSHEHLLSVNHGATAIAQNIYNQLVANWQFNINLTSENKTKLQRDMQRLVDLNTIEKYLIQYGKTHNYTLPQLLAGTYLAKWSTSAWNSWQQTLGAALGKKLPVDPLNGFNNCSGTGFAGYDAATCWNENAKDFKCPADSHIYLYEATGAGSSKLYFNPEFKGSTWRGAGLNKPPEVSAICQDSEIMWKKVSVTPPFTLSIIKEGAGIITSEDGLVSCGNACSATYTISGQPVKLTAQAVSGSAFVGWGGCAEVVQGNCLVTMDSSRSVNAQFSTVANYNLSVARTGNGSGTVTSTPAGINCGSTCSVAFGSNQEVVLRANPDTSSAFISWIGCNAVENPDGTDCRVKMTGAKSIVARFAKKYTLTTVVTGNGFISIQPGSYISSGGDSYSFISDTVVTLIATPDGDQIFKNWSGCDAVSGLICTVTLSSNKTIKVTFEPPIIKYNLNVSLQGTGAGLVLSIAPNDPVIDCGSSCSASYIKDTVVTLQAAEGVGSVFAGWGGACTNISGNCQVTMSSIKNVTAIFNLKPATLTVERHGSAGSIVSDPAGINCPGDCSQTFTYGQLVTLRPMLEVGNNYQFSGWSIWNNITNTYDPFCGGTDTCTLTLTKNITVRGSFLQKYQLTVNINNDPTKGSGWVNSDPTGIDCPGGICVNSFEIGKPLTLYATARTGSVFSSWSFQPANVASCNNSICTFTYNSSTPVTVTATFNQVPLTYKLNVIVAGSGQVTGNGINCSNTEGICTANYPPNTPVSLTATAGTGYKFISWLGCTNVSGTTCNVTIDTNKNVNATFEAQNYTLTVNNNIAPANGVIKDNAGKINCGNGVNTCTATYSYDTNVALQATATAPYIFAGWQNSSDCSGTGLCYLNINGNKTISGSFSLPSYTLSVQKQPVATAGTIIINPGSLVCDGACSIKQQNYEQNTTITLQAQPSSNYVFSNWTGVSCQGGNASNICVFSITADTTTTANFTLAPRNLQVNINPAGSGSVGAGGIACPGDCTETYNHGSNVTLTATVSGSNIFTGWTSVSCQGGNASNICVFSITADTIATANFAAAHTLNVATHGSAKSANTYIISNPAGISCESECTANYASTTTVSLSPQINVPGVVLWAWGGACTGNIPICRLSMAADRTVNARFEPGFTLTVTKSGPGTVTSSNIGGISCGVDCYEPYSPGATVTLVASNSLHAPFNYWDGDCSGNSLTCTVSMTTNRSVTAYFRQVLAD